MHKVKDEYTGWIDLGISLRYDINSSKITKYIERSKRSSASNFANMSYTSSHSGFQRVKGNFVETIGFTSTLNTNDQELVENYLRFKYSPPVNLGRDIDVPYGFCETQINTNADFENYLWSNGSTDSILTVSQPGSYWVEATDVFGLVSRDTLEVRYPEFNPPTNTIFCPNETLAWNPIDGNDYSFLWSDGSVNQINNIGSEGDYSVTITDTNGCELTTDTFVFTEDSFPSSVSLGNDTSLCSGNEISFLYGFNESNSYTWSTGSTSQNIPILESGIYSIQAINSNSCVGYDTIEITIIGTAPSLSYSIENEVCQGSPLNFTESSTVPPGNTIDQVVWNFGEADSVFTSTGAQIYQDSGLYSAFLEVSTLEGCSSKETFNIRVHPKPMLIFSTENYCPYEEISFSASNSYDVPLESYLWEFGQNGNTSLDSNPSYSYGLSGNYDVELIAIDTNSCIDTVVQNVSVQPAPVADISILNPCEYSVWDLTDNSSITDTFEITTYEWNYGDGTDSINPVQGKFYENYGEYTVQLILTADNGCMDTSTQNLTVHPNPIINYQVGPACKNTWTEFKNTSTIPLGNLAESNWLFNLQYSYDEINASIKFPTTGIQLIALQSESDQGCVIDSTFTVDVQNELSAIFEVDPATLISDIPILFSNLSIGADSSYWDFGDGTPVSLNNSIENSITYPSSLNGSSIQVELITVNEFACRDTAKNSYVMNEAFYDLSLETLFAQDINGYLTVGVEIQNRGSIPIEDIILTLKTPENGPIQEVWTGNLAQNENEIYIFNAHPSAYISTQDDKERFVCIEGQGISTMGYIDINTDNNTICKNIEGSGLVILPIYPNPTSEDITLSVLISEASILNIELIDQSGRQILNQEYTENFDAGIHEFLLPFSSLNKGIYHIRVSNSSEILMEKIVRY